ncbi:Endosialidase, N-terminal extension domain-containing protein [Cynara cardunculus var. scolymus]|uniref:Endosialidase, N-terminal extension domain-containing protein n=1 Tax=Cynara cardunculus var. scolymus TaxID=59895 RepID=A0A103XZN3_CYNCS|nr:Endosialidase, N-terminal extension domain-containing protein [Cynara cardunculus var. scolymus]
MQYGAKGDGITDDTKAFEQAWQMLCNDVEPGSSLTVDGGGMINGRGAAWWIKSPTYMKEELKCSIPPTVRYYLKNIGSLGLNNSYDTVEGIYIKRCNFTGTQNGARIKTWQGGSGYARDITFENIGLDNVFNPIIIDQHYCPDRNNCPTESAAVNVSNISYKFFQGTSSSRIAINFNCSDKIPCSGISLDRINIVSSTNRDKTAAYCNNAYGTISSTKPSVTCLSH